MNESATPNSWLATLRRAWWVGSVASAVSTAVLSWRSATDSTSAISGTNAISHWLWGERAKRRHTLSGRYTAVGYTIHHASSVFWAALYERAFPAKKAAGWGHSLKGAAAVATVAATTDYLLTPRRLRPGFERHLSWQSMLLVYGAFTIGLACGRRLLAPPEQPKQLPSPPTVSASEHHTQRPPLSDSDSATAAIALQ